MKFGPASLPSYNLPFIEELYARFLQDENSVDETWRAYFRSLGERVFPTPPAFEPRSIFSPRLVNGAAAPALAPAEAKQDRVAQLVERYRQRGHLFAHLNPLVPAPERGRRSFDLAEFGLSEADLDQSFVAGGLRGTLREIVDHLEETYCRTIGVEIAHIDDPEMRRWLVERMESTRNHVKLTREEELKLLTDLTDAEVFERFLHTSFVGAQRFSLEGGESFIPLVELILERAASHGVEEIVIGMAHRGRLNLMANVMKMPARDIFAEFADEDPNLYIGRGDVKYHLGYSVDREVGGRKVHLSLSFNPSHLEYVNPVVAGRVRSKQDRRGDVERRRVLPLLVHGDSSFAGQGVVAELFNASELEGYRVGGAVHVVINNQIGFTTTPSEYRSSRYSTDVAKMLQIPIFHVNGEDPESVVQVARLAVDFRARFGKDVVIDLYCYRKLGHNEGDDPTYTQPQMYQAVAKHPSIREQFVKKLVEIGTLTEEQAKEIEAKRRALLEEHLAEQRSGLKRKPPSAMTGLWARYAGGKEDATPDVETGVAKEKLQSYLRALGVVPEGFHLHPRLQRFLAARREMADDGRKLDWGAGEALAFASLIAEGVRVRITGQDSERGTFSHRHAALHDQVTGQKFFPLKTLAAGGGSFEVHNSPLSEVSILGFEYGYSLDTPDGLVIWEAQFGDFANAAQVIIDQFIVSGEDKWHRLSGLTLLLPHGWEGGGPEHSSARLDRWLSLCADHNIQVVNATTPAQFFHLLRRQVLRPYRKPLVVMSPKSLLRHPEATSNLDELTTGTFRRVLDDPKFEGRERDGVRRLLLCTGKIYYELVAERGERERDDVAIVRVEQLYPTPLGEIEKTIARYPGLREVLWVQEEPANHGAWMHMWSQLTQSGILSVPFARVTRPAAASPATGSAASHRLEQRRLLEAAFAPIQFPTP
jgi:2-oxoglutarate dehydrogenase E1 component